MYKYDIHVHSKEGSPCGKDSAADTARAYSNAGYDGFVLTDHFYKSYIQSFDDYEKAVNNQYDAYLSAKKEAKTLGLDVFFGIEYRYEIYDFLVLGIDKEFLLSNPDIFDIHVSEFSERVHKYGGIIIQAHPFRYLKGHELKIFVPYVDAIEIYNGFHVCTTTPYPPFYNDLAEAFAKEMHIIGTAGSDNHDVRKDTNTPLRIASMLFEEKIHDINQMAELIKNNRFSICKE